MTNRKHQACQDFMNYDRQYCHSILGAEKCEGCPLAELAKMPVTKPYKPTYDYVLEYIPDWGYSERATW